MNRTQHLANPPLLNWVVFSQLLTLASGLITKQTQFEPATMEKRNEPKTCRVDLSLPTGEVRLRRTKTDAKQTQFPLFSAKKQGLPKKQSQFDSRLLVSCLWTICKTNPIIIQDPERLYIKHKGVSLYKTNPIFIPNRFRIGLGLT
jgi:hypothetical protein